MPVTPSQRIPAPVAPILQPSPGTPGYPALLISSILAGNGFFELFFPSPKVGTAWLVQGVSLQLLGEGLGPGDANPRSAELLLVKGSTIVDVIATYDATTFPTNAQITTISKQLVQPVVCYDSERIGLKLNARNAAGSAYAAMEFGPSQLQVAYA